MEIKDEIIDLAQLFFESSGRFTNVDDKLSEELKEFICTVCIEGSITYDNLFDDDDEDRIQTLKDDVWKDIFNDRPFLWIGLFAFHKGLIAEHEMKSILNNSKWWTSCHGDYLNILKRKWGVIINEKEGGLNGKA